MRDEHVLLTRGYVCPWWCIKTQRIWKLDELDFRNLGLWRFIEFVFVIAVEAQENCKFCFASMWKMMQVSRTCGHNFECNFEVPVSDGCRDGSRLCACACAWFAQVMRNKGVHSAGATWSSILCFWLLRAWMQQLEPRQYACLLTSPFQVVVLLMFAREFFSTSALWLSAIILLSFIKCSKALWCKHQKLCETKLCVILSQSENTWRLCVCLN